MIKLINGLLKLIGIIIIGAIVLMAITLATHKQDKPIASSQSEIIDATITSSAKNGPLEQKVEPKQSLSYFTPWSYYTYLDKMTSRETKLANLVSSNTLNLEFPYSGKNHGTIILRKSKKDGLNVIVQIEKGQIICQRYDDCKVSIRFDDNKATNWNFSKSADGSSETIFINNASKFLASASKAKRILVSMTLYQAGTQILEFNPSSDLVWK